MGSLLYIPYVSFIIYLYVLHKQIYSLKHYTGKSKIAPVALNIYALIGPLVCVAFLIINGIKRSILSSIVVVIVAFITLIIISKVVSSVVLKEIKQEISANHDFSFQQNTDWKMFDLRLDIISTNIAHAGIIISPMMAALMFLFMFIDF